MPMAMTSLSIVLTVFVLQLHHVGPNQKAVPRWIKRLVVDVIGRMLCMGSYIDNHYNNLHSTANQREASDSRFQRLQHSKHRPNDIRKANINATNVKPPKDSNCNGGLNNSHRHFQLRPLLSKSNLHARPSASGTHAADAQQGGGDHVTYDKLSSQLKILVSKHVSEDDFQDVVNEWRLVAHVMDRFLFWLFLIGSLVSSVSILVLLPLMKPPIEDL